jgi:hypothetical protein
MKKLQWQSDVTKKRTRLMLWDWREMANQDKLPYKECKMEWFEGVVTTCDATNVIASNDANQEKDNNTFYWCELAMIIGIIVLM